MQTYILLLVAMGALFYFMILRPQQRAKREKQALMDALGVGSEVMTAGGIYGHVAALREDDLDLEIADGVVLRLDRRAIATVVPDAVDDVADADEDDDASVEHDDAELVDAADDAAADDADAPTDGPRTA